MLRALAESSATTHVGRLRDNNEDTYLSLPEHGLWMVADGMGGHEAGEVASAIVRETLAANPQTSLPRAIQDAHRAVVAAAETGRGAPGMGSTVVALRSTRETYQVAWVGDSRAYLWTLPGQTGSDNDNDPGALTALTTDHSFVQRLVTSGVIDEEQMRDHPDKNVITQCLGSAQLGEVQVDSVRGRWRADQWLLLCSDGLSDELDERAMGAELARHQHPRAAVEGLLQAALAAGGRDNITVVLVQSPLTRSGRWQRLYRWLLSPRRGGAILCAGALFGALLVGAVVL